MKAIKFNGLPYSKLDNLSQALYQSYNFTQDRLINI